MTTITTGVPVSARALVIGLTGGIGSGKSAAAELFAGQGASIVDADVIAHELTAPGGAAIPALREAFGDASINAAGALDRAAMRTLIFSDPAAKTRLEAILHPLIRSISAERVAAATGPYVVLVVPLLIESGHWAERCDRIVVVDCPEEVQIARVMARSNLSEAQVRAIMATQASRATRCAAAQEIIDNAGDFDSLRAQVDALHQLYKRGFSSFPSYPQ
ncbi:dephospho-CoA kinase [Uliginosibacterium sp. H3]|uniref:Dephospho-CoA kinase n=1 Tax=Uliginosibacterium silvisoli TaxID=3114758 RepID=A0ABU6JZT6_9RHOO|nr:dephospho-CoA kinase [Uliginosibacterium sp. H3]MEC5384373.1 dephospho-CoA kinase [Uliginosibacterium sp. H3]